MSYYVEYNPELNKKYPRSIRKKLKLKNVKNMIAVTLVAGGMFFLKDEIMDVMIPGDNEVTIAAFSSFMDDVKAGQPVYDSLVTFCEEIIENAT